MSDSISDFLTVIRNASSARKANCSARFSKMHLGIARILEEDGFITSVEESQDDRGHPALTINLKYVDDTPAISNIRRHSRPGRRLYYGYRDIPRVLGGLGLGILTTSQGVMRDRDARRDKVGGEMVCEVW